MLTLSNFLGGKRKAEWIIVCCTFMVKKVGKVAGKVEKIAGKVRKISGKNKENDWKS